jgi:hypothetical protein
MNIYFMQDRQDQKILSGLPWHGLVLRKMMKIDYLYSIFQVCQMTKKRTRKKSGLLPPKIAEYDNVSLVHGLFRSVGYIYNKETIKNMLSIYLLVFKMIDP